jgi:hypothetical protein
MNKKMIKTKTTSVILKLLVLLLILILFNSSTLISSQETEYIDTDQDGQPDEFDE